MKSSVKRIRKPQKIMLDEQGHPAGARKLIRKINRLMKMQAIIENWKKRMMDER